MLEILSLVGGALVRLAPSVLGYFKEGRDLKYELLRMDKEIALEDQRSKNRLEEISAMTNYQVESNWSEAMGKAIEYQTRKTGDKWLDRVNVSVRPILTYWWCIVLYTCHKVLLSILVISSDHNNLGAIVNILYNDFDQAVTGSIIGFWFVDRALRKER
jgi:hypothetical protein